MKLKRSISSCTDVDALATIAVAEFSIGTTALELVPTVEYNEHSRKPLQSRSIC